MENLTFGGIAALVPEFAVKDLPLDRTLMIYCNYFRAILEVKEVLQSEIYFFN